MRTLTTRTVPLALAALILLTAVACKGKAADDTARKIGDAEVALMPLALADFGPDFADFRPFGDNGFTTAESKAEEDFRPKDEAEDIKRFEWVKEYESVFFRGEAFQDMSGMAMAGSTVAVFKTAEGASGYFQDYLSDAGEMPGKTWDEVTVVSLEPFGADVGDEAQGLYWQVEGEDNGSPFTVWVGEVTFRHGRILAQVGLFSFEETVFQERLRGLAEEQDQRITAVLANGAVSDRPRRAYAEVVSASPRQVLEASARRFQEGPQSFQGDFEMTVEAGGFTVEGSGNMAFDAPDRLHMTMEMGGQGLDFDVEMLMLGTDIYMKLPLQGWVVLSLEELGGDAEQFRKLLENRNMLDLQQLVKEMGGEVYDLGAEIDETGIFRHYRATIDLATFLRSFSDAVGIGDEVDFGGIGGPMTFDIWVDIETLWPSRTEMEAEISVGRETLSLEMEMRFFGYNEPVEIPPPPQDAKPLSDLLELEGG